MNRLLLPSLLAVAILPVACQKKTPTAEPTAAAPAAITEPAVVAATPTPTPVESATPAPAAIAPPPSEAAGNRPGGGANFQQRAEERMQRMKTEVGLSDDQVQKIRAIYETQFASLRQQGGNSSMSREDRRAAFQKARDAANAEIEPLLTAEQKPKWEAFQQEMQARRGQGRPQQ